MTCEFEENRIFFVFFGLALFVRKCDVKYPLKACICPIGSVTDESPNSDSMAAYEAKPNHYCNRIGVGDRF